MARRLADVVSGRKHQPSHLSNLSTIAIVPNSADPKLNVFASTLKVCMLLHEHTCTHHHSCYYMCVYVCMSVAWHLFIWCMMYDVLLIWYDYTHTHCTTKIRTCTHEYHTHIHIHIHTHHTHTHHTHHTQACSAAIWYCAACKFNVHQFKTRSWYHWESRFLL